MGRPGTRGVLVRDVTPGSLAAAGNIQPGEIILSVNRTRVNSLEEYRRAVADITPERGLLLNVMSGRTGRTRYVMLRRR
jgi:serine protease Do